MDALIFLAGPGKDPQGGPFIINDPIVWQDFVKIISSALNINGRIFKMPLSLGYILALSSEIGRLTGVNMPFSLSRYKALTCKTVFSSGKLTKQAGFRFKQGNANGISATLEYYLRQGLL